MNETNTTKKNDSVSKSELNDLLDGLLKLKRLATRTHYHCEDSWYSCPKSEDGCANDEAGEECNCGADKHNAEVDALYCELSSMYI